MQPLVRKLTDCLQHPVALAGAAEEALVDERGDCVDVGTADRLGGLERAAAGENGEAGEQVLLLRRQQIVAPGDRRPQRSLSLRRRPGAPGEQRQPLLEPLQKRRQSKHLHPCRSELDRKRQTVEPAADLDDLAVRHEVRADSGRPLHEELDRFPVAQRVDGDLPLAVDVQRLPARDEHGQLRTRADRLGYSRCGVEQMLEVVEHEQQPFVPHRRRQRVLRAERLSGGILDECRIGERGERHPPDTVVVVVCGGSGSLQREPRLAASTRAGQCHQPDVTSPHESREMVDLLLATEKRRRRNGQVRLVQRLQRRERFRPELEEALRRAQVLQAMQAEIAHLGAGEVGGRLGQQHLTAVPGSRDPRGTVHVKPDVALVGPKRLPRVQAHPHPHWSACQADLRIRGSRHCIGRTPERNEESVALRVDLHPVAPQPGLPQHTPVLGKHLRIPVTQLREQPRRPLDVGEEERHRPGRKLGLHPSILSRRAPDYQGAPTTRSTKPSRDSNASERLLKSRTER